MNDKLKELIQPYWVEEQQGVYIPLIDKVLLKDNIPAMPYHDFMEYAKNGVKIATKDELLQMYLQRDQINKILKEHNGDTLAFAWFGSSSKSDSDMELVVHLGSGLCNYTYMDYYYASRAVVNLKN